jgi:dTDP-4-dehydrorhamnose 3,5-epimerase
MELETTPIEGLLLVRPRIFNDERGFFYESYNAAVFERVGLPAIWLQDNHARSGRGTLRGMHFQLGPGQGKLVRCTQGHVWDVAIDIRPGSPTFGQWHGIELNDESRVMYYVPAGFAHGYCVLSETAEVQYKCTTVYDAALECEFAWNDPEIGVRWPVIDPILSKRDVNARSFAEYLQLRDEHESNKGANAR